MVHCESCGASKLPSGMKHPTAEAGPRCEQCLAPAKLWNHPPAKTVDSSQKRATLAHKVAAAFLGKSVSNTTNAENSKKKDAFSPVLVASDGEESSNGGGDLDCDDDEEGGAVLPPQRLEKEDFWKLSRFDLTSQIGQGGFGDVFQGTFRGQAVAIKRFKGTKAPLTQRSFRTELETYMEISHPNIVAPVAYCDQRESFGIVFPLLIPLQEKLQSDLSNAEILLIVTDLAEAVCYLHENHRVHRDIKPDNVLLQWPTDNTDKLGRHVKKKALLCDVGIMRKIECPEGDWSGGGGGSNAEERATFPVGATTATGTCTGATGATRSTTQQKQTAYKTLFVGTPIFADPQSARQGTVQAEHDLYSLAVTIAAICSRVSRPITVDDVQKMIDSNVPLSLRSTLYRMMGTIRQRPSAKELVHQLKRLSTASISSGPRHPHHRDANSHRLSVSTTGNTKCSGSSGVQQDLTTRHKSIADNSRSRTERGSDEDNSTSNTKQRRAVAAAESRRSKSAVSRQQDRRTTTASSSSSSAAVVTNTELIAMGTERGGTLENLPVLSASQCFNIRKVDVSFNELHSDALPYLDRFSKLHTLILDNNRLTTLKTLPVFPALHTLWLNKNELAKIFEVVVAVSRRCPELVYLSLMQNPCAPSPLFGSSTSECHQYRILVRSHVPTLQLLDAQPLSTKEIRESDALIRTREEAANRAGVKRRSGSRPNSPSTSPVPSPPPTPNSHSLARCESPPLPPLPATPSPPSPPLHLSSSFSTTDTKRVSSASCPTPTRSPSKAANITNTTTPSSRPSGSILGDGQSTVGKTSRRLSTIASDMGSSFHPAVAPNPRALPPEPGDTKDERYGLPLIPMNAASRRMFESKIGFVCYLAMDCRLFIKGRFSTYDKREIRLFATSRALWGGDPHTGEMLFTRPLRQLSNIFQLEDNMVALGFHCSATAGGSTVIEEDPLPTVLIQMELRTYREELLTVIRTMLVATGGKLVSSFQPQQRGSTSTTTTGTTTLQTVVDCALEEEETQRLLSGKPLTGTPGRGNGGGEQLTDGAVFVLKPMAKDDSLYSQRTLEEDPRTGLKLVSVPPKYRDFFPSLDDALLHWFGWAHISSTASSTPVGVCGAKRRVVLFVNSTHLVALADKPGAEVTTDCVFAIEISHLSMVLVGKNGFIGFKIREEDVEGAALKLETENLVHQLVRVLQSIYAFRSTPTQDSAAQQQKGFTLNVLQTTDDKGDLAVHFGEKNPSAADDRTGCSSTRTKNKKKGDEPPQSVAAAAGSLSSYCPQVGKRSTLWGFLKTKTRKGLW